MTRQPNLQNPPIRTTEGRRISDCFPAFRRSTFSPDYAQLERDLLEANSRGKHGR